MKYADLDGDKKITPADRTWIYNPVPDLSFGLNVELAYKNFDFRMFRQGVLGQDVYNDRKFRTDFGRDRRRKQQGRPCARRLAPQRQHLLQNPHADHQQQGRRGKASSYFVENGSYAKLRTLRIGYNLPEKILSKLRMTKARVYLSGRNLLTLKSSSLTCSDPENANWAYPIPTSFSFGFQLDF